MAGRSGWQEESDCSETCKQWGIYEATQFASAVAELILETDSNKVLWIQRAIADADVEMAVADAAAQGSQSD